MLVVCNEFDTEELNGVAIFTIEVSESISLIKRRSSSLAALRSIKFIIILLQIQLGFKLLSCFLVAITDYFMHFLYSNLDVFRFKSTKLGDNIYYFFRRPVSLHAETHTIRNRIECVTWLG